MTLMVSGGLPLILGISAPITLGEVRLLTLLLASELTASNLSNQLIDVGLFVKAGKIILIYIKMQDRTLGK